MDQFIQSIEIREDQNYTSPALGDYGPYFPELLYGTAISFFAFAVLIFYTGCMLKGTLSSKGFGTVR